MTGSTINDPRFGLKPGLYDAGETAMGMQHLDFLNKPAAFQLRQPSRRSGRAEDTRSARDRRRSKIPKPMKLVIAQLAFANSDFAFQGTISSRETSMA